MFMCSLCASFVVGVGGGLEVTKACCVHSTVHA